VLQTAKDMITKIDALTKPNARHEREKGKKDGGN